jgi:hypothetical protein
MTCSNTNSAATQAFALALAGIAAAIFPMAAVYIRMGRVRALERETARERARERDRQEREAHAPRIALEARASRAPSPGDRERRRAGRLKARQAEAARLNAEMSLRAAADGMMSALRLSDRVMNRGDIDPALEPDMRYPSPDEKTGLVPAIDHTGRVLAVARPEGGRYGLDYYYDRRTRSLYSWTSIQVRAFVQTIKDHPDEARRMAAVREARAAFWDHMARMRGLDEDWGL